MNKLLFSFLILFFIFCTCGLAVGSPNSVDSQTQKILKNIKANPQNSQNWLDLGDHYFNSKKYNLAQKIYLKVLKMDVENLEVLYRLGLCLEAKNNYTQALKVFKRYEKLPKEFKYRELFHAKYFQLNKKVANLNAKKLLSKSTPQELDKKTVAVLPFKYIGNNPKYAVLGKGLSDMLITDLSQIPDLTMVERIRVQALIDELALQNMSGFTSDGRQRMYNSTKAGRLVYGLVNIDKKNKFNVNVVFANSNGQVEKTSKIKYSAPIGKLYLAEKKLVFNVIKSMNIKITPAIQKLVLRIPTKNFQAFHAYCLGLDYEDKGDYQRAVASYSNATKIDPAFTQAVGKVQMCQQLTSLSKAGGVSLKTVQTKTKTQQSALVENRLSKSTYNMGTCILPTGDMRQTSDAFRLNDLPMPPPVPNN